MLGLWKLSRMAPSYFFAMASLMPAFTQASMFSNCETRYGLKPVLPRVTSTFDCPGALMYARKSKAASLTSFLAEALMAPDQPPNAANGAWLTPSTARGQVVALQSTSCPVPRSSTRREPGRTTVPTLSCTVEVLGSMASVPMSPQSMERAQRPEVNSPRVSPTSRFSSPGGPYCVVRL